MAVGTLPASLFRWASESKPSLKKTNPQKYAEHRKRADAAVDFLAKIAEIQKDGNRHYLLELPWGSPGSSPGSPGIPLGSLRTPRGLLALWGLLGLRGAS